MSLYMLLRDIQAIGHSLKVNKPETFRDVSLQHSKT